MRDHHGRLFARVAALGLTLVLVFTLIPSQMVFAEEAGVVPAGDSGDSGGLPSVTAGDSGDAGGLPSVAAGDSSEAGGLPSAPTDNSEGQAGTDNSEGQTGTDNSEGQAQNDNSEGQAENGMELLAEEIEELDASVWVATANVNLTVAPSVWDGSQIVITGTGQTATSVSFTVAGLPYDSTAQVTATAEVSVDGAAFAAVTPAGGVYTIGGLSSGTKHVIRVRAAADDNHYASDAASASLPTAYATPNAASVLTVLYAQEVVQFQTSELPSNYILKLNGQTVSNNASLSAAAEAVGTGTFALTLTRVGPDATIPASEEATLNVTGKSAAPVLDATNGVVVAKTTEDDSNDGYITYYVGGTPAAFEYRPSGSADVTSGWVSAPTGATAHSLPLGNFDVRLPATAQAFASKILTVAVQSANASTYLDMNGGGASATLKNPGSVTWSAAGSGLWKAKYEDYPAPTLPSAAWTGHVFGGWYRDKAGTDGPVATSDGTGENSVTYYAKWTDFTLSKAGAILRTGETAATVKFSSTVSGSYYFTVTAGDAAAPSIDTGGTGTALTAGQTVTLALGTGDGMAAGARSFYVQAKDAQGNLSNRLRIDIGEYSAPVVTGISAVEAVASGGNTYVPLAGTLKIVFDQAVDTAVTGSVSLDSGAGPGLALAVGSASWNNAKTELTVPYSGLAYGTVYNLVISGFEDPDGNEMATFDGGAEGAPDYGHVQTFSAPAAPTGFTAAHASATSALLTWTAPADFGGTPITGYEYKIGDGAWTAIPASASATSYTITGLAPKTARTFALRAVNAAGKGADAQQSLAAVTFTAAVSTAVDNVVGAAPVYGTPVAAKVDSVVTVPAGQDLGTLSYVWRRHENAGDTDGAVIAGATGATYTPVAADIGKLLTVTVGAANATGEFRSAQTLAVERRALTITVTAGDKPFDGTAAAEVASWSWLTGPVSGDETAVSVSVGTATFDQAGSADADTVVTAHFTGFTLTGAKQDCYTLTEPSDSAAKITKGFDAAAGTHYTLTALNAAGWTNAAAFAATAKSGYEVSLSGTAAGPWTDAVTLGSAETSTGALDFYVRNHETGAISRAEGATWKLDRTAPTAQVTIRDNAFTTFLNTLTFGFFFKNTTDIKVEGTDALSGVARTEYLSVAIDAAFATADEAKAATGWTTGSGFSVAPGWKGIVYGRVTDAAGNVTVVSSNGVVIYQDSGSSSSITYTLTTKAAKTFDVVLHGNEVLGVYLLEGAVASLADGSNPASASEYEATLTLNNEYAVDTAGDVATFSVKGDWLESLAAGSYTLAVTVKPLGASYVAENDGDVNTTGTDENDAPAITLVPLTVVKQAVTDADVTWPTAAGVTYGSALSGATLSGGSAPGGATWTWDAPTAKPVVGNAGYAATLAPSNAALQKYDYSAVTLTKNVAVAVNPLKLTGATSGSSPINGFVAAGKTYDGTDAATVTFTPDNLVAGDLPAGVIGTITAHFASGANAAAAKTVTIDSMELLSNNYALPDFPVSLKAEVAKAPATGVAQEVHAAENDDDVPYTLSPVGLFLPALAGTQSYGTVTYEVGSPTDSNNILTDAGAVYDAGAGTITVTVRGGATAGHTATVPVTITSTNFSFASPAELTVRTVGSAPRVQPGGPVGASVFTGETVNLSATAAESGISGTWAWYASTNDVRGDGDDTAVGGATGSIVADGGATVAQMTAPTGAAGTVWYYAAFTNSVGTSYSGLAKVEVTARTYTGALTPGTKDFGSAVYGYPVPGGQVLVLKNTGNQSLAGLSVALGAGSSSAFEITQVNGESPGTAWAASPASLDVGGTVSVSVRPKGGLDAAGAAYTDTLTFTWTDGGVSGSGSGTLSAAASLTFAVTKASGAVTLADPDAQTALVYSGAAVVPAVTANAAAADAGDPLTTGLTWHWRADAGSDSPGTSPYTTAASAADLPKNAGAWQVYASTAATTDFEAADSNVVTYTIGKKALTITAKAQDKDYDGTKTATLATGPDAPALVGVVSGEEASVTLTAGTAVFDGAGSPDADTTVAVKFSGFGIGGGGAGNYSFTQPSDGNALIRAGFDAAVDTDYTLTALTGGYTNQPFTVSGANSALVSLSGAADAVWTAGPLTLGTDETAAGARSFYVKRADGTISRAEAVAWKIDKTAPTAEIEIKNNAFKTFVSTVTFGLFFKETVDITITAADAGSVATPPANSGVDTVEYLLVADGGAGAGVDGAFASDALAAAADGWQAYNAGAKPSVAANWKGAVYAKVTDVAGNAVVVNSDGVVVYTDSASSGSVSYVRTSKASQSFDVTLNGNTIDEILVGDAAGEHSSPLPGGGYSLSGSEPVTVTLSGNWLDTLEAGDYTVVVTFKPLGETYAANNTGSGGADTNAAPAKVVVPLTVSKAVPEFSAITANGETALAYGQRLSAWAVSGTAVVPTGFADAGSPVSGSFAWADATIIPGYDAVDGTGAKIPGGDTTSASGGLAPGGYAFAVTWTPSSADSSYGAGKASDYFAPVTVNLTATAKVSQAVPYMASGDRPQGSAINLASYGGTLAQSVISGTVYYDFAENVGSSNVDGKTAVSGAWAWDNANPADVHYTTSGMKEDQAATFTPSDPRVAAYQADGNGGRATPQVPVFSPSTKIILPSSYTIDGFYGATLADVTGGVYGLDAYLKGLGFKAVEDGGGDLTNAPVIPGTFSWAASDPSTVSLTAAGGSQTVVLLFTPDDEVDALYTPGSGFAKSTADVVVTLSLPALGGTVTLASDASDGAASYGATLTASGATGLKLTPDVEAAVGFGTLTYVWKRYDASGAYIEDIAGATGATYTLVAADVGKRVGVVVTAANATGQVASDLTAKVAKAAQDAPGKPSLSDKTSSTVRVAALAGLEYSIDGGANWISDGASGAFSTGDGAADGYVTFSGLSPKTAYQVTARRIETDVLAASAQGAGLSVTTQGALYYSVEQIGGTASKVTSTGLRIKFWSNAGLSAAEAVTGLTSANVSVGGTGVSAVDGSLAISGTGTVWTVSLGGTFADGAAATVTVIGITAFDVITASAQTQVWRDVTGPALTAGSVARASDAAATIGFTADEAGTAYYFVAASGADPGTALGVGGSAAAQAAAVVAQGTSLGAVPTGASSGLAVALTAGAKDIYVVCVDAGGNAGGLLKIAAGKAAATLTAAPSALSGLAYTGAARTLVAAGTASGGTLEYAVVASGAAAPAGSAYAAALPTATAAGSYDVYYRVAGDANHEGVAAAGPVTVSIAKAVATVSAAPAALPGLVYDGTELVLVSAGTSADGTLQYAVVAGGASPPSGSDYAAGLPKASGAGSWDVYYRVAGDGNHLDSAAAGPVNVIVQKGTQAALVLTGELPTAFGETRSFTVSGGSGTGAYSLVSTDPTVAEVTVVNAAAGTFKVKIIGSTGEYRLTYGRASDDDYEAASQTSSAADASKTAATIGSAPAAAPGLVYDGSAQALVSGAGGVSGGTVKYWLDDGSGMAASDVPAASWSTAVPEATGAGPYTVWYKAFGDADHNDTLPVAVPVSIAKAPAVVPALPTGLTASYGATLSAVALPAGWSWDEGGATLVGAAGAQAHPVTYTPADTDNYLPATGLSVSINVAKADPVAAPSGGGSVATITLRYGEALSVTAADLAAAGYVFDGVAGDGTLTGTLTWDDPAAVASGAAAEGGSFVATAVFTPTGASAANYGPIRFPVTVQVLASQSTKQKLSAAVSSDTSVRRRIDDEDEAHGQHAGLHEDDYKAGVLKAFVDAYAKATAVAADAGASEKAVNGALAALSAARDALVQDHPVSTATFGGAALDAAVAAGGGSGGVDVAFSGTPGELVFEIKGHLPHVTTVTIVGPNHTAEETLWAVAGGAADENTKTLKDAKLGRTAGTLSKGSAVVTLAGDYLAALSDGTHAVKVTFADPLAASAQTVYFTVSHKGASGSSSGSGGGGAAAASAALTNAGWSPGGGAAVSGGGLPSWEDVKNSGDLDGAGKKAPVPPVREKDVAPFLSPWWLVALAVAVLIAVLILKRRRDQEEQEE
ncbi:MAG: YDG domain-containing protein [Clostridiales Family XIII bacterium]|jgi:uncharacterized repeat protein (TIGR02543 family)|nr:YDG domain-containing protein [Clostridiales Family XIII bacterium]